jgi:ABC-2 type transport system permease protein
MTLREQPEARVIAARKSLSEQARQLWDYRGLLVRMVRKELQVRYKNSALGFLWSMLNPALYLAVFYVVFQLVLGAAIPDFAVFLLAGLLAWNLFFSSVTAGTISITANATLVGKVYFPREVLPLAAVGAALVHFFLQAFVLLVALAVLGHGPSPVHSLMVAPTLFVLLVLVAGMALFLGAANVYLRDTQHFVELALLAWFWMTPIVYPQQLVAERLADKSWSWVQWLNPMTTVVVIFQRGLYNVLEAVGGRPSVRPVDQATAGEVFRILPHGMDAGWYLAHLGLLAVAAIVMLLAGLMVFGRLEANFAEEL